MHGELTSPPIVEAVLPVAPNKLGVLLVSQGLPSAFSTTTVALQNTQMMNTVPAQTSRDGQQRDRKGAGATRCQSTSGWLRLNRSSQKTTQQIITYHIYRPSYFEVLVSAAAEDPSPKGACTTGKRSVTTSRAYIGQKNKTAAAAEMYLFLETSVMFVNRHMARQGIPKRWGR